MKQKILLTYIESGFGHISAMDGIYGTLMDEYADKYDIEKSFIMRDDDNFRLKRVEKFFIKQVQNTNKISWFGDFIFGIINLLGGHHIMRFVFRQLAFKAFHDALEAIDKRKPDIIVTNHFYTDLIAVEYKRRYNPDCVVINYNPDCTLHTFWDRRDGIFIVNNQKAFDKALKLKFDPERLRLVTPCARKCVEDNTLSRAELRDKFELPQDKFTVTIADGGYMMGKGHKFARALIKAGLPITLCILAGNNKKRYDEFAAIAEGRGKIKVKDGMTIKVYGFLPNAHELYGASDLFLTKGGPNAVLDSIYMRTPVMVDYCPHMIEDWTVKIYVNDLGCGETAFKPKKAVRRISTFLDDRADLERYAANIEKFLSFGNGSSATAGIIDEEAEKQRLALRERGVMFDCDVAKDAEAAARSAHYVLENVINPGDRKIPDASSDESALSK